MKHTLFRSIWRYALLLVASLLIVSCDNDDDEDEIPEPEPTAAFSFAPQAPTEGDAVSFTNESENATTYAWTFGDGGTSTDENPTYTYAAAGTYTITLTVTGPGGEAEASQSITVAEAQASPNPIANFSFSPSRPMTGEAVSFTNQSTNASAYEWDFDGDGTIDSQEENPSHTYEAAGTYTVKLIASNADGVSAEAEKIVTVEAPSYSVKILSMDITAIDYIGTDDLPTWDEPAVGIFDLPLSEVNSFGQAVWVVQFSDEGITAEDFPITLPMDLPNNDLPAYVVQNTDKSYYFFLGGRGSEEGTVSVLMYHEVVFSDFVEERPTSIELRSEEAEISYTLNVEWTQQ